jgi:autotransporter translocation and assembly factor TamB
VASLFVEDLDDAGGSLALSGTVGGTRARPEVVGELVMTDVGLTVPTLMQKLHHVNGRVALTKERVTIHGIDGQLDSGRFGLSGHIDIKALEPTAVDLKVTADALPVQIPDTADIIFDTKLRAHGNQEKSVVEGEVLILEGTYYRDVNLSLRDAVGRKTRQEQPRAQEIDHPFLKNMTFDITVKARNPLMVQNNLAELDINPDLRLTGKLNQPVLRGRAEVESGTVTYQKKNFVVKRGVVDFLNPYETEATLDIESEVKVRRWDITLTISGTPDDLNFKLSSNPPEEDGDILSLLLIGQTTGELIDGEGGSSASTSQMLAQAMASSLTDDIKGVTGLDILEVDAGEGDDAEQVKVTMGEELSKRIVVKHDVESKNGEIILRAITEYRLLQNLSVSGFQDNRGIFGGQLKFRLEFR